MMVDGWGFCSQMALIMGLLVMLVWEATRKLCGNSTETDMFCLCFYKHIVTSFNENTYIGRPAPHGFLASVSQALGF